MALNFPNSPAPGEVFTAEGATFVWNGTVWNTVPSVLPFASNADALTGLRTDVIMSPANTKHVLTQRLVSETAVEDTAQVTLTTTTSTSVGQTPTFVATSKHGILLAHMNIQLAAASPGAADIHFQTDLWKNGVFDVTLSGDQLSLGTAVAGFGVGGFIAINRRVGLTPGETYQFRFRAWKAQAVGTFYKMKLRADFLCL